MLAANTDAVESQRLAEAIVKSINDLKVVCGSSKQITATAGVASLIPRPLESNERLLHDADKALYRAKAAGRNRAVHADSFDD